MCPTHLFPHFAVHALLATFLLQPSSGQLMEELPDESSNATSNIQPATSPIQLRICEEKDNLSSRYCQCKDNVVNCDFSTYPSDLNNGTSLKNNQSMPRTEIIVYGYQVPSNTSRLCICNTPKDVHLIFTKKDFLPSVSNRIHRFDLYNLQGETHFDGGFSNNFHGDLYMANVSMIPEIKNGEMGVGDNEHIIKNVQDLKCCSPIKIDQQQKKPILFIENTTISRIQTRGITDLHSWKTFLMKSVLVERIQSEGIIFDSSSSYDVAIMGSKFENVSRTGIIFRNPLNLLMVKNYFTSGTADFSWWSRSPLNGSNVLMMNNVFWNRMLMSVDAQHVVSWSNIYDLWDNETFHRMRFSSFSPQAQKSDQTPLQRSISIRYNLAHDEYVLNKSLDFGGSRVTFKSNVLGTCNCSLLDHDRDELLKPELQYCFTGSIAKDEDLTGKCSVRLDKAMKKCAMKKKVDFAHFCKEKGKGVAVPGFPGIKKDPDSNVEEAKIYSDFMSRTVHDFDSYFGPYKMTLERIVFPQGGSGRHDSHPIQDDEHSGNAGKESHSKNKSAGKGNKSKGPALPIFATLVVTGLIIVSALLSYRYRYRCTRWRSTHQRLHGSQDTFI